MLGSKWVKKPHVAKGSGSRNYLGEQKQLQSLILQRKNIGKHKISSWLEKPPVALLGDPHDYCH